MAVSGFNAELGQQQFLELMVKQLQYQDPLEPVGQQEFLQQMAQFSMVEGVEQLNTQFADVLKLQTLNQGTDLIGQTVEYQDAATGDRVQGRVNETRVIEGQLTLLVDDQRIPLAAVDAIIAADPAN
ncbi:MAG: flagellar hook capping protein [Planctomicrobium sp.]|jgi:flagellar basal-body rod modification protein FlgD|nr:flagellar hook capping protein [Planctomicrobium sp.]